MKPPEAPPRVTDSHPGQADPAVSVCADEDGRDSTRGPHPATLGKLRKRPEFLRVARGRKSAQHGLIVQARPRPEPARGADARLSAASAAANDTAAATSPAPGGPAQGKHPAHAFRAGDIPPNAPAEIRLGITCSRKVGNAVTRNRARRRLRAVAREVLPELGQPGWDYVLIGRAGRTATMPFDQLRADLVRALSQLHQTR